MNILIADDHDIFRQSLALLIENRSAHKVIGHVSSFADILSQATEMAPDCILLDYHMPGGDPMKTFESLKRYIPGVKVVMLTGAQSPAILKQLTLNGFAGVLHKKEDADTILLGLDKVSTGETFISPAVGDMVVQVEVDLTQRETQVLSQYMKGLSPARIADTLNISVRTVEKHKENMMRKLSVSTTVELVEAGHRILIEG